MRSLRLLLAAAAASTLAACAAVGPDFQRPASPVATGYLPSGEAVPAEAAVGETVAADWWAAFRSPQLDAAIREAVAGNPSLAQAQATLRQARSTLAAARGEQGLQADLNAGAQRERLNLASFGFQPGLIAGFPNNPEFSLYSIGGAVTYPLDVFGGTRRSVENATALAEAQAHEVDAAYLTLTGQVAVQAATIAALKAEIATVEDVIRSDQATLDLAQKAIRDGGQPPSSGVSASAQLAADQSLLPPLRRDLARARHALSVLAGHAPADWTPPDFDLATLRLPASVPVSLPSALVHARPDILAAEARLHAATAAVGVATARLYPTINLTGTFTQSALDPSSFFDTTASAYSVGAGLTAPLLNGGQLRAQRQAAREAAAAAEAAYRVTVTRAFGQVADLLAAVAHDDEQIAVSAQAEQVAQSQLEFARRGFRDGGTGVFPVIDAQRTLSNARLVSARALASKYVDVIQLFVATGTGLRPS